MKKYLALFFFVLSLIAIADDSTKPKSADDKPTLHFKAKHHFQDLEKNLVILDGNVELTYGTTTLTAGRVRLDRDKFSVTATDNVLFDIPDEQTFIKAHELTYNYLTKLGELINAEVKSGYSRIRAKKMFKVGEQKYRVEKGVYTTCNVEEDEQCPWRIWTYRSDITIGGYATAEHPVFIAGGVPIFYSPFAFFPVKSERQTGFLIPEFGGSEQTGFRLKNALFLALGRSHDATPTFEYLSKRGFKEGLEYRYVWSDLSSGLFSGYYIQDREFYRDFLYRKRFSASYDHSWYFTPKIFNKSQVRLVSDDDYVKDFQADIVGRQDAGLETKFLQGFISDHVTLNAEGVYYQSLVSENPRASNKEITHKLPELRLDVLEFAPFGEDVPIQTGANLSYVNFYNEGGSFKDVNSNSKYNEGTDLLLRSQRMDVMPQVSMPLKFGRYFAWVPTCSLRQTHWWLPVGDPNKNRFMMDLGSTLSTKVSRIFALGGKTFLLMKHLIEPRLSHHFSPLIHIDDHIPAFDGIDQIASTNILSWGLQHRLIFKALSKEHEIMYMDGLRFDVSQDFDILEATKQVGERRPLSDVKSVLSAGLLGFSVSTEADYNMYGDKVSRVSHGMGYTDPWTNVYNLNYTYSKKVESNSINGVAGLNFIDILKFHLLMNYSFDRDVFLEKIYNLTYIPKSKCWALNLNFEDKLDTGLSFSVGLNLLFGENPLSLARLYQFGERENLKLFAK